MSEFEQEWLNEFKKLETPRDIVEAIAGLSRQEGGKVMVKLENEKGEFFWFNPKVMQEEEPDKKGSSLNISAKLMGDVQHRGFRIVAVEPLEVDENRPRKFSEAVERLAEEHDCHIDDWGYAVKLIPDETPNPSV